MRIKTGIGYDVHRLVEDRDLWLGGIKINHTKGLLGHSDADVLLHAICDALLGAISGGDIGKLFPDNSPETKDIDSKTILSEVAYRVKEKNCEIGHIDSTIVAQEPKIAPYIDKMRETISILLDIDLDCISIKATTTEGLGFTGKKEGISAYALATLYQLSDKETHSLMSQIK